MIENAVHVVGLTKYFGEQLVLKGISLDAQRGEVLAITGPSGCGKSTLLNLVSSLLTPDKGLVEVTNSKFGYRGLAYMMQDSLLLPWFTLWENALLGARLSGANSEWLHDRCDELFEELDLSNAKHILPDEASGGMVRRVALIRILACNAKILLLDEPFANLDFDVKLRAQRCLLRYREPDSTIILVTHDIEDAIVLSDRVVVLSTKPTTIKAEFKTTSTSTERDPLMGRATQSFNNLFADICGQLHYLDGP